MTTLRHITLAGAWLLLLGYGIVVCLAALLRSAISGRDAEFTPSALLPLPLLIFHLFALRPAAPRFVLHLSAAATVAALGFLIWIAATSEGAHASDPTLVVPALYSLLFLVYYGLLILHNA